MALFATGVRAAIRGQRPVAYRLAVRRDRYEIGRDLTISQGMYIVLVHAVV